VPAGGDVPAMLHNTEGGAGPAMPWEKRRHSSGLYFTVSRRGAAGRIVRTYFGAGPVGALAAAAEAERRGRCEKEARRRKAQRETWDEAGRRLTDFCAATDGLLRAALLAAGLYRHGGEWRRRGDVRHYCCPAARGRGR